MTTVRLLLRRHRLLIGSWLVLLWALCAATPWAYQNTYPTAEARAVAVHQARAETASTLLLGELPLPGTPAQMFAWEIGGIVSILVAIFAVLLAVALTRAGEDDGTLELIRGSGVARRTPLLAALTVLTAVAATAGLGAGVAAGLWSGHVDGVTWSGAAAFGAALTLVCLLFGTLTAVLAQLASTAPTARLLGSAGLLLAFVLRGVADVRDVGPLNWVSPLAVRATVLPFTANRWWALGVHLAVAVLLGAVAVTLDGHREYRAGMVHRPETRDTRLPVRSVRGLRLRLARRSLLIWTCAVGGLAVFFTAMGSGVVDQSRTGEVGGFLGAQLGADPVAGFCRYAATLLGIVVGAYAILQVSQYHREEAEGRTALLLSTGIRRRAPLLAQTATALLTSAAVLAVAAVLAAAVAPATIGGTDPALRMFVFVAGQWPATAAMAGAAAMLAGLWPRALGVAWLPLAAGGVFALLGTLLEVPRRILDWGPFQQVPDPVAAHPDWWGLPALLLLAAVTAGIGLLAAGRRDLLAG
ncbi:hypothetical protein [Actinoplanes sp. NPDC049599]|uniref:hypothetical protein n=1 Tax=Actinoplanes sp. NPDC049599 TaxID=3363903 RepID=UPI0037AA1C0D